MKVWIFQTGEPLHCDGGNPRPMRAMNLANQLIGQGHEVVIWSSGFYHQEKQHRSLVFKTIKINDLLTIHLIPSCGYRRNIGFGRLLDHAQLGYRFWKILNKTNHDLPDIAYIGYPPIEPAFVLTRWLKRKHIPSILDVKDQWPDIFIDPLPNFLKPIGRLILIPYYYMAISTINQATAVSSMSETFLNWVRNFAKLDANKPAFVVPLTTKLHSISSDEEKSAKQWWQTKHIDLKHKKRAIFIGSLSRAFDFSIVLKLAELSQQKALDCEFVICGDGEFFSSLHEKTRHLTNVKMVGWIDYPKIVTLSKSASATLSPYISSSDFMQSIPNKIIDSLSMGLPILTTLKGLVSELVEKNEIGYAGDDAKKMFTTLDKLLQDDQLLKSTQIKIHQVYQEKFDFDIIYNRLIDDMKELVQSKA